MTMNTWELSGALTRMGEKAYKYAKLRNKVLTSGTTLGAVGESLVDHFDDELSGLQDCVTCIKGFNILWDFNFYGEITKVYITYHGDLLGIPWRLETKGGDL